MRPGQIDEGVNDEMPEARGIGGSDLARVQVTRPLTNPRHERFAQALASGKTAAAAYVEAGYKRDDGNASRLTGNDRVRARLAELLAARAERAIDHSLDVESKYVKLYRYVGAEIDVTDDKGNPTGEKTIRDVAQARKCLDGIARLRGLFVDRKEVGRPGEFADLTADELEARFIAECKAAGLSQKHIDALLRLPASGRK